MNFPYLLEEYLSLFIQNLEYKQTPKNIFFDFYLLFSSTQNYLLSQILNYPRVNQGYFCKDNLHHLSVPPAVGLMTSEMVLLSKRLKLILDKVKIYGFSVKWIALHQFHPIWGVLQLLSFSNYY